MRITNFLIALLFLAVTVSCKKGETEKPVYKFYCKLNGKEYFTNQTAYDSEVKYISDCYYSTASERVYFNLVEPKTGQRIYFSIEVDDITKPAKKITLDPTAYGSYAYFKLNSNDYPSAYCTGTFEITELKLNSSTFELSTFSGRFDMSQTAKHSDGVTRTTTLSEGEINKVGYL